MNFKQWFIRNIGGTAAAIFLLAVLVLLLGKDISRRTQETLRQRQELAARLLAFESFASLRTESEKANQLLSALQTSLPTQDELIGFSKYLEDLAGNNQLGFGFSFGPETIATEQAPGTNNFTITARGNYLDFVRFLRSVEQGKYFTGFDSFNFNRKSNKGEFEILTRGKVFSR